jgi:hypothetical protein
MMIVRGIRLCGGKIKDATKSQVVVDETKKTQEVKLLPAVTPGLNGARVVGECLWMEV